MRCGLREHGKIGPELAKEICKNLYLLQYCSNFLDIHGVKFSGSGFSTRFFFDLDVDLHSIL